MSVSLYKWTESCDGHKCCGDCDECDKEQAEKDAQLLAKREMREGGR